MAAGGIHSRQGSTKRVKHGGTVPKLYKMTPRAEQKLPGSYQTGAHTQVRHSHVAEADALKKALVRGWTRASHNQQRANAIINTLEAKIGKLQGRCCSDTKHGPSEKYLVCTNALKLMKHVCSCTKSYKT